MVEKTRNSTLGGWQFAFAIALCVILAGFAAGCAFNEETNPPRSATEQLLMSTVADRALQSSNFACFDGEHVFVVTNYLDGYDVDYALGTVRDALSRAGALLVEQATNSDLTVEVRSGALSIDASDTLIGMPQSGLPIPLAGSLSIPELALYKSQTQYGYAKLALLAYATKSRKHVYSSGPLVAKGYNVYHKILFVSWITTDIPEKKGNPKKAAKDQTWFPQYDPSNQPPSAGH